NRLASTGLLEAAVLATAAARALAGPDGRWPMTLRPPTAPVAPPVPRGDDGATRAALQDAMWRGVGVERDADGLATAARELAALPEGTDPATDNLLMVGRLAAAAATLRTESRGAHFRGDHPVADPAQARRIAWVGGLPVALPPTPARPGRAALALEAA
ncbi:MAG: L-aspartate oxidase, partial [Thermoleophilia bacterium]